MDADQLPKDGFLSLSAEYLVAADLTRLGYAVSIAAEGLPYDLIVDAGRYLFKVQVKSTYGQRTESPTRPTQRYIFRVDTSNRAYSVDSFDIIAFVASDLNLVGYMSAGEVMGVKKITFRGPDDVISSKSQKSYGLHDLPFKYAHDKAYIEKSFSLDEELTKAFGKKP